MSANTISYNNVFLGRQLRPNANVAIDVHRELGRLLKSAIYAAEAISRVQKMIDAIRSELDEWAMRETTTQQLDQNEFYCLYYGEVADEPSVPIETGEMIKRLEAVIGLVVRNYPFCTPTKSLVSLARKAILSIGTCDVNQRPRCPGSASP